MVDYYSQIETGTFEVIYNFVSLFTEFLKS